MDPDGSSLQKIALKNAISSSTKTLVSAFLANAFLTVLKAIAFFLTRSPAIFSEAIHSAVDTVNQGLLFLGFKLSLKAGPTASHHWGTYQIQYLFNFVSALVIFFIGCLLPLYFSIQSLLTPEPYSFTWHDKVGVGILLVAIVVESIPFIRAIKTIKEETGEGGFFNYLLSGRNMTIIAIFLEDLIAIAGVGIALSGQYVSYVTQSGTYDAIAGILIAVMLGMVSGFLLLNNSKFLLGQSLPEEDVLEIKSFIETMPEVERVTRIGTEVLSVDKIYLSLEVEFHGAMIVDGEQLRIEADRIKDGESAVQVLYDSNERMVRLIGSTINEIERRIRRQYPKIHSIDLEIN